MQEFYTVFLNYNKPGNTAQHDFLIIKDDAAAARAVDNRAVGGKGGNLIAVQHACGIADILIGGAKRIRIALPRLFLAAFYIRIGFIAGG